jgi:hypothetical protein
MLRGSGLIGCDYKMMQSDAYERDDLEKGPCLALYSPGGRVTSRFRESTSRVRLGVLYTVRDLYSFLSEYFCSAVLVLHASRCRVAHVD